MASACPACGAELADLSQLAAHVAQSSACLRRLLSELRLRCPLCGVELVGLGGLVEHLAQAEGCLWRLVEQAARSFMLREAEQGGLDEG